MYVGTYIKGEDMTTFWMTNDHMDKITGCMKIILIYGALQRFTNC